MTNRPTYAQLEQRIQEIEQAFPKREPAVDGLNESEEKYRIILETIEDSYLEVDLEANFIDFNTAFCNLLCCSKDELRGKNVLEFVDSANAEKINLIFNGVYETGNSVTGVSFEYIRKDGTVRSAEASVSLIKDNESRRIGFRGIGRDITERKHAEEALRKSEEEYRNIIEK